MRTIRITTAAAAVFWVTLAVAAGRTDAATFSLWSGAVPAVADSGPDSAVEIGLKFRADSAGTITAIRFYKSPNNTGTHVGNLWTSTGTRLATATYTGETSSGWQQVKLSNPISIAANTVYVVSYHTNTGHYSDDTGYFSKGFDAAPLHALADGNSGYNGVYAYGSSSSFPSQGWQSSNYWVDVAFTPAATSDTTAPTVTSFSVPSTSATLSVPITSFTATDNVGVTGYLVSESATPPSSSASGWSSSVPTSYTFVSAGKKTLYAWARDAAGNLSTSLSGSVSVTLNATFPEPSGWLAGDPHVHRSCGGSPQSVNSLYQAMVPENLTFISLLADMGNGEVQNASTDLPQVNGDDASVSTPGRIVHWDAEWHWDADYFGYPHQALGGHLLALGLSQAYQIWEEYTYPILSWAHQQGGIAGFAHMQYLDGSIPQTLTCCTPIEYPVEVALGAADFIEEDVVDGDFQVGGQNPEAAIQAYYRLLNCGFRPGLAAGTDHPCNRAAAPLGALLTYVQVGDTPTYRNWISGIANGRTVISRNGHDEFLELRVNGTATPGDEISLPTAGSVPVTVNWTAITALTGTVELVQNGTVIASKYASIPAGGTVTLTATADFSKSGWLAARRMDSVAHQLHTSAVFVLIANAPIRVSADDANYYVQWMDNLLEKTSPGGPWNGYFDYDLYAAQTRYQDAKALFQQIAAEAAGKGGGAGEQDQTIFSSQVPSLFENDDSYELGTRFWSDVSGQITQVRLYTNSSEGGTHTVRIWRASDATVIAGPFSWDVAVGTQGWRSFTLPTPLSISANTDYVVAVSNSSDHYYSEQANGLASPLVNGHLHTYVGSGVYATSSGTMPSATWQNTNYFRDVIFLPQN